jgi:hypothetical protein
MTPTEFTAARQRHGSQRAVAVLIGIGFRTLQRVEDGTMGDPIPVKYERMIAGLSNSKVQPEPRPPVSQSEPDA